MESKAFASTLAAGKDWRKALEKAAETVAKALGGPADAAAVFVTELYPGLDPAAIAPFLQEALGCKTLLGCNASGVIGGEREIEGKPAVSLMGMRLPGARVEPFQVSARDAQSLSSGTGLVKLLDLYPTDAPKFLLLADPASCDIEVLLGRFNEAYPGSPVVGGLASGLAVGKPSWLILDGEVLRQGAAGLAFSGEMEFEVAVAQGCRPVGEPLTITKAEGNVLHSLGGRPPLTVLREMVSSLPPADRELARHSLFAGLLMDEAHAQRRTGDYLVRNLMGYDPESGALMVGASLRPGQTLQFQLRDARTSAQDLESLLGRLKPDGAAAPEPGAAARGALLASCCGRGQGLYGKPDYDSGLIQKALGPLPLAGFFANGEFGPVGGRNFVHGYTSSLVVIR